MKKYVSGFNLAQLIFVLAGVLVLGGLALILSGRFSAEQKSAADTRDIDINNEAVDQRNSNETVGAESLKYSGTVLAGSAAPLLDFRSSDYEAALETDKLVVLYFYANWCPVCRAEFPVAEAAFNSLESDDVIGFRVNFNDNQTDGAEVALARQFGVAYQHTKVFVKNKERILKSPETWDKDRYLSEIAKY